MRWILDDGPLDQLAEVIDRSDECDLGAYVSGQILIPSATAHAARSSPSRKRLVELLLPDGQRFLDVFEVLLGGDDPAEGVLRDLHREERTATNLAEREAIAWPLVHGEDAVFVTADTRAALTALAELGRMRVAHPFDLWLHLREQGVLATSAFKALCQRTKRRDQGLERMPDRVAKFIGLP